MVRVLTDVFGAADWFNIHVRALDVLWRWLYKSWVLLQLFYVRASASDTLLGLSDRRKKPILSVYMGEPSLGKSIESKKQLKLPISETQEWEESCLNTKPLVNGYQSYFFFFRPVEKNP